MLTAAQQFSPGAQSASVRQFSANTRSTQSALAKLTAGERVAQFGFASLQDEYIQVFDARGQARMQIGAQSDGTFAVVYAENKTGPPPPTPSTPIVSARQIAVVVAWDGLFTGGAARPGDFARVDVHMSNVADFVPDGTTVVGMIPEPGSYYIGGVGNSTRYIKIVTVSHQKKEDGTGYVASAATEPIPVLPLAVEQLAARVVGAVQISADVGLLSRLLVGHPDGDRVELEGRDGMPAGFRSYDPLGVNTLDITGGDITMRGTFRTGIPGAGVPYIEIPKGDPTYGSRMRLYGTDGVNPAQILAGFSPRGSIAMTSPRAASNDNRYGAILLQEDLASLAYDDLSTADGLPLAQVYVTSLGATIWAGPASYLTVSPRGISQFSSPSNFEFGINQGQSSGAVFRLAGTTGNSAEVGLLNYSLSTSILLQSTGAAVTSGPSGAYKSMTASSFITGSAAEGKTVVPLPFDLESLVATAPAMAWERSDDGLDEWGRQPFYVGPLADHLPVRLQRPMRVRPGGSLGPGIDTVTMSGVLWGVAGRHITRLDGLDSRVDGAALALVQAGRRIDGNVADLGALTARVKSLEDQMVTVRGKLGIKL